MHNKVWQAHPTAVSWELSPELRSKADHVIYYRKRYHNAQTTSTFNISIVDKL